MSNSVSDTYVYEHDPLCPYIEDTDGVVYAWNECECDLIAAVRNDQTKILNSRVMYQSGYTDGFIDARKQIGALVEIMLLNESKPKPTVSELIYAIKTYRES